MPLFLSSAIRWYAALPLLVLLAIPQAAHADIVFSNFSPSAGNGFGSSGWLLQGTSAGYLSLAVAFTPSASYNLTSIEVAAYHSTGTNSYTFSIVDDSAGAPGTTVVGSGTTSAPSLPGVVSMSASGALTGGTTYWLVGTGAGADTVGSWRQNDVGHNGFSYRLSPTGSWIPNIGTTTTSTVFRINGTLISGAAPEPGALAFLALGGTLVFLRKRSA